MKTRLLLILATALFLFLDPVTSFAEGKHIDWANRGKYAEANSVLPAKDKKSVRVVFMGDSITEGWVGKHNEFFLAHGFIGRGISGQVSYQMVQRMITDVIGIDADIVVINAGTNDVAENQDPYDETFTYESIITMVRMAQAHGIKPIMTSVLPHVGFGWNKSITDAPAKIMSLNARLEAYAKANKIPFVNYFEAMKDSRNGLPSELSQDGVHPNVEGYKIMESLVLETLKKYKVK